MTELEALSALRGDDLVQAVRAEAALWAMWHRSGDPRLDSLLREGIEAIERQDLPTAAAVFTRLIEEAPTFAEGWNKRATVRYLAKDYSGAIADCRETLARRSEEHTSELQSLAYLVCRLLLEKKKQNQQPHTLANTVCCSRLTNKIEQCKHGSLL